MIRRKVLRKDLAKAPYLLWNAYVELLALGPYEKLSSIQRAPHLCFWYDSEIQNGGHLQYFANGWLKYLDTTLAALTLLEGDAYAQILKAASSKYLIKNREPIGTVENYVATALQGELDTADKAFYRTRPTINDLLERYLEKHKSEFIELG